MAPWGSLWTRIVYFFDFLTNSPWHPHVLTHETALQIPVQPQAPHYPIISPPECIGDDPPLPCTYPEMPGWEPCFTSENRSCWLKGPNGQYYDIHTNYETNGPKGIDRYYTLEVQQNPLSPDGTEVPWGLTFDGKYPGPRIQACWGDRLHITVKNNLPSDSVNGNGTTIHWHGLRQWNTDQMDGVNGVTQCPIAPGKSYTYVFNATQYGTSWYHSHYSLQYANGLLGPLTIYGPASANYGCQQPPLVMTDWNHESAFTAWDQQVTGQGGSSPINTLLNGIGHWPPQNCTSQNSEIATAIQVDSDTNYPTLIFQQGVSYLLRLINGAIATTYVFSIDNHHFWVISTDFVPIKPYRTDHVVVGIGQRYNIIVEAFPDEKSSDGNYWIRTTAAINCNDFDDNCMPDNTTGIIRYDPSSQENPTTQMGDFDISCADETYTAVSKPYNITPIVPWQVSPSQQDLGLYNLSISKTVWNYPYWPCNGSVARFMLINGHPMWLNFSNPTLLNLDDDYSQKPWLAEVTTDPTTETWIKLTISLPPRQKKNPEIPGPLPPVKGTFIPSMHPIHLHGHDFALLAQCVPDDDANTDGKCNLTNPEINLSNPPRRDVAFLPSGGYLIIAFRADNPGVWLMHCHIAFHASMGLALQIMENKDQIKFPPGGRFELQEMCNDWDDWMVSNNFNASDPCMTNGEEKNKEPLQEDSGI